jgi:hypothetical protein
MSRPVSLVRTEAPAAETGAGIRVLVLDGRRGIAILVVLFLFHDLPGAVDRWL